jgi:hypothetical protein
MIYKQPLGQQTLDQYEKSGQKLMHFVVAPQLKATTSTGKNMSAGYFWDNYLQAYAL